MNTLRIVFLYQVLARSVFSILLFSYLFFQCTDKKNDDEDENCIPMGELIITEGDCFPGVVDAYSYPIKIWTEEWYNMLPDEKMNACQLPDDVLKSISSLGLIRSFIDTPHTLIILEISASSISPIVKYRSMFSRLNGVKELLTRKDAAKSLMTYYAATSLDCYKSGFISLDFDIFDFAENFIQ